MHRIAMTLLALPPVICAIAFGLVRMLGPETPPLHPSAAVSLVLFYALFVYASVAAVALPIFVALAWLGRVTPLSSAIAGATASLLIPSIPAWSQLWDTKLYLNYRLWQFIDLWPFAILGALSGLAFWLVALRGNPLVRHWNTRRRPAAARSAA